MSTAPASRPDRTQSPQEFVSGVRERVAKIVVGQDVVVERVLIALLTGGHLLLQGLPGLAKTLLVNSLAKAIHLDFKRVQFTVDMLPSDIIGSEIIDQKSGEFRIHRGPIFSNLLLADEINRAAPKVQGAMLEAMQERKVTIGGQSLSLPVPFLVIATQNPVEQSGTFDLPEAQLDRFMLLHRLDYPGREDEQQILMNQLGMGLKREGGGAVPRSAFDMIEDDACGSKEDLVAAMEAVQAVHVSEVFVKHCVELTRRTRESKHLDFGCSPRAGLALINAARARAVMHDRDYVTPDDLFDLAEDVVLHRIRVTFEASAAGHTGPQVLEEILAGLG
ncbi:MoxR family ATPase [Akkermansiaceae bacterium]|jgi:MoxR-like ATPase|nr:MoxR family ATPase [Akkermansiaceae bacterium]